MTPGKWYECKNRPEIVEYIKYLIDNGEPEFEFNADYSKFRYLN